MIWPLTNIKEIDDIMDKVNNFKDFQQNLRTYCNTYAF